MAARDAIFVERLSLGGNGPRVAVKDTIDVAGTASRCGSRALADAAPAARHAEVVERLLAGGAQIVGKANMHELAYGVTGVNGWTGTAANARYPGRVPGGSSSGSAAAVAAGLADFAIGTDTGGSIRVPAACCGIAGLKPSFGRVSRIGVAPERTSLDCVGPFARDAAGLAEAMRLICDFGPVTLERAPVLGVIDADAEPAIGDAFAAYLAAAGVATVPVALPLLEDAYAAGIAIIAAETFAAFGDLLARDGLGDDVRARLAAAGAVTAEQLDRAERVRAAFTAEVEAALCGVDALALPTLPIVPPRVEDATDPAASLRLTEFVRPFNLSGHPALTLPAETAEDLPAGIQLVGARGADERLCAVAIEIERRVRGRGIATGEAS